MSDPTQEFWEWFQANQAAYRFVNEVEDEERMRLVNELGAALKKGHPDLTFLIGGRGVDTVELVISAEGIRVRFPQVEALVAAAPPIEGWEIIAFKPPQENLDFKLEFLGIALEPKNVWFVPLRMKDQPELIGLRVGFVEYEEEREKEFMHAIFLLLDIVLGEKSTTLDLAYLELKPLPVIPREEGWMPFTELRAYVRAKKKDFDLS